MYRFREEAEAVLMSTNATEQGQTNFNAVVESSTDSSGCVET